jgi:hypothetical protein
MMLASFKAFVVDTAANLKPRHLLEYDGTGTSRLELAGIGCGTVGSVVRCNTIHGVRTGWRARLRLRHRHLPPATTWFLLICAMDTCWSMSL